MLSNGYGLLIHHQYQAQIHNTKLKLDMILDQKKKDMIDIIFRPKKNDWPVQLHFCQY